MGLAKIPVIALLVYSLSVITMAQAQTVHLATGEREPFIGQGLPNYGYVHEVVKEAFLREGYQLKVTFYPWARANALAKSGRLDGVMPVNLGEQPDKDFVMSASFPGDSVGLLKRKRDPYTYSVATKQGLDELLMTLSHKRIGMVRGSKLLPEINAFSDIELVKVNRGIQSLDMLYAGRVNFVLMNKHTAASLMIDKRPHYIGRLEFIQPPLADKQFHIAFTKQSGRVNVLVNAFNRGLKSMEEDGRLRAIQVRHGLLSRTETEKGNVHLTIGTVNNPDMKIMHSLSSEFEQMYPHIKLEWQEMRENILRRRLLSDLALSEANYDIMTIGNYEVPIWAKNGWIAELNKFPDDYDLQDIFPSLRDALSYKGRLYAAPFYAESIMTYYRKDLFIQAELQMPEKPTFDDIERFARIIHNPKKGVYGICLRGKPGWGENTAIITSLVNAFGGRWFNQQWEPQLNTPEWKAALTFYIDLLSHYGPPNAAENGYVENLQLFSQGHCGIWIDATVAAGQLFNPDSSLVADKVGFAPAPRKVIEASWLWAWTLVIPESSENKEAALAFISWATSKNYVRRVAEMTGWVSVPPGTRRSTYMSPEYLHVAPFAPLVLNALEKASIEKATLKAVPYVGVQYVGIPEFVGIGSQLGFNSAEILRGNLSVEEALERSQSLIKTQMSVSGYLK